MTEKICCNQDCNQGRTCPVRLGAYKPADAVHQIDEPALEALRERMQFTHARLGHAERFVEAPAAVVAEVIKLADRQHARIAELESQLEAIGAGGVEPLRKCNKLHQIAEPATVQAAPQAVQAVQAVQAAEKIQAAPCVTPADVEAAIASEHYYTGQIAAETEGQHHALGGILNCTLVMKNGQLVNGEALLQDLSKPDPERAKASARRRAFDKAYDMVVYAERERLAALAHPAEGLPARAVELEVDDLIDRLLDAQQDLNLAANVHMDQSIASASTLLDEVEIALRTLSATHPSQQGLDAPTEAARSVLAERARQVSAEGWTPEADDSYNPGVLALHGGLYACHAYDNLTKKRAPEGWQWDEKWWKPKDPRSNLVKAGALILAEIERMDRSFAAQAKQGDSHE